MRKETHILLVPGSTRRGSTNVAALRAAVAATEEEVTAVLFEGLADLPAFSPDDDHEPLPQAVAALREQIASADGILFCTPEYAGGLPGSFKNLLDWTVGGPEMDGKPVAWINVAPEGRGLNAHESLRTVLGYLHAAVFEPAGRRIFVPRDAVGPDGAIHKGRVRAEIADALRTFVDQFSADRRPHALPGLSDAAALRRNESWCPGTWHRPEAVVPRCALAPTKGHRPGRNVIGVNTNQQQSDGATRLAYILGVPLADNVVRQWPQMNEVVRTSKLVADIEGNFPELTLEVGRRLQLDDVVVVEWTGNYGDGRLYRNVTIGELEDGQAVRVTDYWGEPTVTPEWRQPLTDRLDMPGDGIWPDSEHLGHY